MDFGTGPKIIDVFTGEVISTWVFVMTLAWSRHQYAEIVRNQKVETWLGCHRRAFEFFGGVPQGHHRQPQMCHHQGLLPGPRGPTLLRRVCRGLWLPDRPLPTGIPKRRVASSQALNTSSGRFLPLREFRTLADGNRQLIDWILGKAGNRIHGTTKQRPLDPFRDRESPAQAPARCAPGAGHLGQGQASWQLPCPVREGLLLGPLPLVRRCCG